MAFRLEGRRPIDRELQRLVRKDLDQAIEALTAGATDGGGIHDARKRLKKVRAVLRLLHDALGPDYDTHNSALREAAHRLSTLRDAEVLRETFTALHGRYASVMSRTAIRRIDAELERHARREQRQAAQLRSEAVRILEMQRDEVIEAVDSAGSRGAVRDGLERSYRRARRAVPGAGLDAGPADFHLWRRRVKDVWYQVSLFERSRRDARDMAAALKGLEQALGDDHNLAVLRDTMTAAPKRYGDAESVAVVLGCITRRQRALRLRALDMGARLFAQPPKRLRRRARGWIHILKVSRGQVRNA